MPRPRQQGGGVPPPARLHARRMEPSNDKGRRALVQAVGAYLLWGFLPLYFRALGAVPPFEIVAQRILWSLLLLVGLVFALRRTAPFRAAFRPATLRPLAASAVLIAVNWLVYIWAVAHGHVLEASLGYYLNPLLNVLLGVVVLRERLTAAQVAATLLAAAGVGVLALGTGAIWVSLTLGASFALYGLVRKMTPVEALEGLAIETALLAPLAAAFALWLAATDRAVFGEGALLSLGVVLSGAVTVAPLLLFNAAARRLRYSTIGILQYLAPTIQFLLAALLFGEEVTRAHAIAFGAIWLALAIYAVDALRSARRGAAEPVLSSPLPAAPPE